MSMNLPAKSGLNVGALSSIFMATSTSYKYLFFIALVQLIEERLKCGDPSRVFGLSEINSTLLSFGWYPHRFFKLSFGASDQVGKILDQLDFKLSENSVTSPSAGRHLKEAIQNQFEKIEAGKLQRFVPQRLLTPFFSSELKGLPDHRKDDRIRLLANQTFTTSTPPLYRFCDDERSIELHLDWGTYLKQNFSIVRGWAMHEWANFLQKRNPNTPAIIRKIAPPAKRKPLQAQRDIWKTLLAHRPVNCIYSGKPISSENFHLDHFLPWSFLCHDQHWNLIPSSPQYNLWKGRSLPTEPQVESFIATHENALSTARHLLSDKKWNSLTDDYIAGLNISSSDLLNQKILYDAYSKTL